MDNPFLIIRSLETQWYIKYRTYVLWCYDCTFTLQGAIIQLMGSATALPEAPVEKTLFEEDMSEQQRASQVACYFCDANYWRSLWS